MTDASTPSPAARRIAAPRWLDVRLVLGIVLVLASVLAGAVLVSRAEHTTVSVVATSDLAAGTVLRAGELTTTHVQLPGDGRGVYLTDLRAAVGKQLVRPLAKGELLPRAALGQVPSGTTLTVPFAAGTAPQLRAGQRIELWLSTADCPSAVLLPDVTVQSAHTDTGGSFGTGGATGAQSVIITVTPALAQRVITALASDQVKIRAGVLTGTRRASTDTGALADLEVCLPSGGR